VTVRILRQPTGSIEGISLNYYRQGQVYDVPAAIGEYLVAEGFAIVEMRKEAKPGVSPVDRRRKPR
jgi:hypothetical protein